MLCFLVEFTFCESFSFFKNYVFIFSCVGFSLLFSGFLSFWCVGFLLQWLVAEHRF